MRKFKILMGTEKVFPQIGFEDAKTHPLWAESMRFFTESSFQ
jgi:hypothetical protein